ncbi:BQ2448_5229 [Microbotryum intermedium]|uniref:BQ2448_5229 protein n=1 Tax=Microbotryum intermedium TaxID=269621 RepID=A0A238F8W8_9BASI|nr:BQ2448_5229 [Microbotryum intermedium]
MGRQARTKQADPTPLAGSSSHPHSGAHKGKRKALLEAKAARGEPTSSKRAKVDSSAKLAKAAAAKKAKTTTAAVSSAKNRTRRSKQQQQAGDSDNDDDDDIRGMQDEDVEDHDGEEEDVEEAKGLAAARSALFDDEDLNEPGMEVDDDEKEKEFDSDRADDTDDGEDGAIDDEFELGSDDEEDDGMGSGVMLDDYQTTAEEAEQIAPSGKKALKRAQKAAEYNSDDETPIVEPVYRTGPKISAQRLAPEGEDEDDADEFEDEDDEDEDRPSALKEGPLANLRAVERRMRSAARVLGNWKELGKATGKSRSDLVEQIIGDICQYHGYTPYLTEKLFEIFPVDEALEFFNTSDTPRPLTIRVNTLKTRRRDLAQALINRGVNLEPLEGGWSKVGLQVFSGGGVPVGATPEYLSGHYILQSASSFLPTTYMSALMGNTGEVWANDSSRGRIKGLGGNVARLGCRNVVITNVDGREFPRIIGGFDRVLLDAPCSGTGVISKDQSVKINKTERDFTLLSHLQKQLVLCAIDSVSPNSEKGGYVVYSTCSVTTEENEAVVSYALRKRPHVKLVETGLQFGKEGFKSYKGKVFGKNMHLTRRFYPHVHNMDGFYVAKFKVGKPDKHAIALAEQEDNEVSEYQPLGEKDHGEAGGEDQPKFDDEQDEALIKESQKRYLKKKGVNPKVLNGKPSKA